ncbi:MAG: ABC transporter permease [Chloracidobacterium sp.]|nr:ABC transporter permease [Chloracidobacterium sp.]
MMNILLQLWRWALSLLRRRRYESDMEEEIRFHLEMQIEQNLAAGMAAEEARHAARRQFGNLTWLKEVSRAMWSLNSIETLIQDLRYGARMLMKNPSFTLIAVMALALGIGANTAVFSLLDLLLFKSLPVKDPQRLVFVHRVSANNKTRNDLPASAFEWLRESNHSLSGMAAYQSAPVSAAVAGQPEMLLGDFVSSNYFDVLGVGSLLGRTFVAADDQPGQPAVAVISYGYWRRQFAHDPLVVGKTISLGKIPVTVIGVTPPSFLGLKVADRPADVTLPISLRPRLALKDLDTFAIGRAADLQQIVARLNAGVSYEQARAELDLIYQRFLAQAAGASQRNAGPEKIEFRMGFRGAEELPQNTTRALKILASVVGLILLIASVNVAGLLLALATARRQEVAVRLAIGSSRFQLIRQLLTESALLAVIGGAVGLFLARWGAGVLSVILFQVAPASPINISIDARVIAFTAAVSLITGVLFGLAPALAAIRIDLNPILKGSEGGPVRYGLGKSLVVIQVALSLTLLIAAGLMIRSLRLLYGADTGFERDKVLTLMAYPALIGYKGEREANLDRELIERIGSVPGVQSASLALFQIYRGAFFIGPRYFETEGIGLVAGREFSTADLRSAVKIAVVSESLARKYFPNENPIGQRFGFELGGGLNIRPKAGDIQIVGVARDISPDLWKQEWIGSFYLPFHQAPPRALGQVQFLVRTAGDPNNLIPAIRRAAQSVEQDLPLVEIKTQAEEMNEKYLGGTRSLTTLLVFFSSLALTLAVIGLYGTMSYTVGRRTREIGIRIALGAQSKDMLRMALGEALLLAAIGVLLGLPLAAGASRLIKSLLFGVTVTDPMTISSAILVMLTMALLAGYFPARRATKIDPMDALRSE